MYQTVDFGYGRNTITGEFPAKNILNKLENRKIKALDDPRVEIINALNNPIDSPPLKDIVKPGEKIVVVISDITRSVGNRILIPVLLEELTERMKIPKDDITILTATGTHRPHTAEELIRLVGEEVYRNYRIIDHEGAKKEDMVYLGTTSRGTPIYINKLAAEADKIITTGGIIYHSLAGFGGGKKSICPGICSYETIQANHKLILNDCNKGGGLHPGVGLGKTAGNPMAQDLIEIARRFKPHFMINTILNEKGQISRVVAGDVFTAHENGCKIVEKYFGLTVREQADFIVISCGGYPKDIDLYQATKAIENTMAAVRRGGRIILLAECSDGLGSQEVFDMLVNYKSLKDREKALRDYFTIARAVGYILAGCLEEKDIILISSLPDDLVKRMGIIPKRSLKEALKDTLETLGPEAKGYLIPHASETVTFLKT